MDGGKKQGLGSSHRTEADQRVRDAGTGGEKNQEPSETRSESSFPGERTTADGNDEPAEASTNPDEEEVARAWLDTRSKGQRLRARLVRTAFKYPFLRVIESVTNDPAGGDEDVIEISRAVASHLLVVRAPGYPAVELSGQLKAAGFEMVRDTADYMLVGISGFERLEAMPEAIRAISDLEGVAYVEPDYLVTTLALPDDPAFGANRMWNLHNSAGSVSADRAWDLLNSASSVVAAVTDTGVRYDHEDLASNMWVNPGEVAGDGLDNDGNGLVDDIHGPDAYDGDGDPMDGNGHGTHCAGTIGAAGNNGLGLAGVAWRTQLLAARFLGPTGAGTVSDAVSVIDYCRESGASIINASWGGRAYSNALHDAILRCHSAGIVFVAAAGNNTSNTDTIPNYPSAYDLPNVVSVAASTQLNELASFSNFGVGSVDLAAPGSRIWSAEKAGPSAYGYRSGTSMAAPHVAGALALAKALNPSESPESLIARLHSSVDSIPALKGRVATGGKLNVYRLLAESSSGLGNDNFQNAFEFSDGNGSWTGNNGMATREADEDDFALAGSGLRSVWFRWTAGPAGPSEITASADRGTLRLLIFKGTGRSDLTLVTDSGDSHPAKARFLSEVGITYFISVDSAWADPQRIKLSFETSPANDLIADASPLGSLPFTTVGSNRGATRETWETTPISGVGAGKTVWWRWNADASREVVISTSGSDFDTVLGVFGEDGGFWSQVASNDDVSGIDSTSQLTFPAVAGTSYWIAVDSYGNSASGNIRLSVFAAGGIVITEQPVDVLASEGQAAEFKVAAISSEPIHFQWFAGNQPIPGATQARLVLPWISSGDFGSYRVDISNSSTLVSSATVELRELRVAPAIEWLSPSQVVAEGTRVSLGVRAKGSQPLAFQWFKDGVQIPGGTESHFDIAQAGPQDGGIYQVKVSNSVGVVDSSLILLKITSNPWDVQVSMNPRVPGGSIKGFARHGDVLLALSSVSQSHEVRFSLNGSLWTTVPLPDSRDFAPVSMVSGNGRVLVSGLSSGFAPPEIYRSSNGTAWERTLLRMQGGEVPDFSGIGKVVFFDGRFYGMANFRVGGNRLLSSADGEVWRSEYQGEYVWGEEIVASPAGLLLWMRSYGVQQWFLPPGGVWQRITLPSSESTSPGYGVYYNGKFLVSGHLKLWSSTDGIQWSVQPVETTATSLGLLEGALDYDGKLVSWLGSGYWVSTDGMNWNHQLNTSGLLASRFFWDGDALLVGTSDGLLLRAPWFDAIQVPKDGSVLSPVSAGYGGGMVYVSGSGAAMISSDGISWKTVPNVFARDLTSFVPSDGVFSFSRWWFPRVMESSGSPFAWRGAVPFFVESLDSPTAAGDRAISFAKHGDLLVALVTSGVSGSLKVWSTSDGIQWLPTSKTFSSGTRLESCGQVLVAIGSGARTQVTQDLQTWMDVGLFTSSSVLHLGTHILQISPSGFLTSTDGIAWTAVTPAIAPAASLKQMQSFNGAGVGIQSSGFSYSYNLTEWTNLPLPFVPSKLVPMPSALLIVGPKGEMIRLGSGPSPAPVPSITSPSAGWTLNEGSSLDVTDRVTYPGEAGFFEKRLRIDGELRATSRDENAKLAATGLLVGNHLLELEVEDATGATGRDYQIVSAAVPSLQPLMSIDGEASLPGGSVTQVHHSDGVFHAWGGGRLVVSFDARTWKDVALPAGFLSVAGMTRGGGTWVATTAEKRVLFSTDGVSWTGVDLKLPSTHQLAGPLYLNGRFYLFNGTTRATSLDGRQWEVQTVNVSLPAFKEPIAGNPDIALIGGGHQGDLWVTRDAGLTWARSSGVDYYTFFDWNGTEFVVRDNKAGGARMGRSSDGTTWTWGTVTAPGGTIKRAGPKYFAYLNSSSLSAISNDGSTWSPATSSINGATIFDGRDGYFYGTGGYPSSLLRSTDGLLWTSCAPMPPGNPVEINGRIYSVSFYGALHLLEGSAWVELTRDGPSVQDGLQPHALKERNGLLLMATKPGALLRSADQGLTWSTAVPEGISPGLVSTPILDNGSVFLFSSGSKHRTSMDGVIWNDVTSAVAAQGFSVMSGGDGVFLGIRSNGEVRSSPDGLTWTRVASPGAFPALYQSHLIRTRGWWLALGNQYSADSYKLYRSADGSVWEQVAPGTLSFFGYPTLLVAEAGVLIGTATSPTGWRFSQDLVNWSPVPSPGSGTLVAGGETGFLRISGSMIYRSTDASAWSSWQAIAELPTGAAVVDSGTYLFTKKGPSRVVREDLIVRSLAPLGGPGDFGIGDRLPVELGVGYLGQAFEATMTRCKVWLTRDSVLGNSDDLLVFDRDVEIPASNGPAEFMLQLEATIPDQIDPAQYALAVLIDSDDAIQEINESNNQRAAGQRDVRVPGWVLDTLVEGDGMVTRDNSRRIYPHKSTVSLGALGGKGMVFDGWYGDETSKFEQISVSMESNKALRARFVAVAPFHINVRGAGQVLGQSSTGTYGFGSQVTVSAVPQSGWRFARWEGDLGGDQPMATAVVTGQGAATAVFELPAESWKSRHFSPGEMTDPRISGDNADPDGDGFANWIEYIHDSSPVDSGSRGYEEARIEGSRLVLIYQRNSGMVEGFGVTAEATRDLGGWGIESLSERIISSLQGVETVEVSMKTAGRDSGFIRLRYKRP